MTNFLFLCAGIVFAIILAIMIPGIGQNKKIEDFTTSYLAKQAKIVFPLGGLVVLLALAASLNGKFHWF
jgi:hypothetical protein